MNIKQRNNVNVFGDGDITMVLAHGFGCDQNMWRYLTPAFSKHFKILLFDLVGSGGSNIASYDYQKYDSLQGYADDLLEVINEFCTGPVVFVGHSVSAMIGMLASIKSPKQFLTQIMVGPSPCYINDGDYCGGFSREDIEDLCHTMESNYLGWSSTMAPAMMGAPEQPELGEELTNSFCRTDPQVAKHFARVTFLSDHRADVPKTQTPTLILQCSDDFIAPCTVGEFLHQNLPNSTLQVIDNVGHCPHLSAPDVSTRMIQDYLQTLLS